MGTRARCDGHSTISSQMKIWLPFVKLLDTALENLPKQLQFKGKLVNP